MLQLQGHEGTVHALTFGTGQSLVSAGRDRTVREWDLTLGTERSRLNGHGAPVLAVALHSQGRALASGAADGCLKLWDLTSKTLIANHPNQLAAVTGLAWLAGRSTLLMACGERMRPDRPGELRLWNFEGPLAVKNMHVEHQGFWSLAVARQGAMVAWSGGARIVSAWDITHQQPKSFRQSAAGLVVGLSPDGRFLASTSDRAIKVWDVERGRELATLEGHRGLVRALAFSPDGSILASGGQDRSVRFWRVGDGTPRPCADYEWPTGAVHALAFSPDGLTAAAAGEQGLIWVWDVGE